MPTAFVDTNIFLRHLLQDHPEQSSKATAFLFRIERGEQRARIADTVVFEIVFTLQRQYRVPKAEIREQVLALIELPAFELRGKDRLRRAFDRYVELNLSFADAYHSTLMEWEKLTQIVSFDRGFDRVPGITRVEPS